MSSSFPEFCPGTHRVRTELRWANVPRSSIWILLQLFLHISQKLINLRDELYSRFLCRDNNDNSPMGLGKRWIIHLIFT